MSFRRGFYKEVEDVFAVVESLNPMLLPASVALALSGPGRLAALRKETLAALRRGRKAEMALAALSLPLAPVRGVPVVKRR